MLPPFDPRELNRRLTLERSATAPDQYNQEEATWTAVGTYWASVRQLSGREAINADRLKITASHLIRTRYFGPATAADRWRMGDRVFNIQSVNNVNELNAFYEFMADEVVNPQ